MSTAAPPLAPDLELGLRRLKLATIRAQAPERLQTARTQRWAPEEVLRTLVMAEIAARDLEPARAGCQPLIDGIRFWRNLRGRGAIVKITRLRLRKKRRKVRQ